jgi:hypothetical protein
MPKIIAANTQIQAPIAGVRAGTGGAYGRMGGVLYSAYTAVGNVGGGTDTLHSFQVPSNTLSIDGQSLWFDISGSFANNANVRTLSMGFGADVIDIVGGFSASANYVWQIVGRIIRTGAATQRAHAICYTTFGTFQSGALALTRALSTPNNLTVRGLGVANNDIVCDSFIVGWSNDQ